MRREGKRDRGWMKKWKEKKGGVMKGGGRNIREGMVFAYGERGEGGFKMVREGKKSKETS